MGYIRVRNTDRAGLFETEGQFRTEFGGGRVIASDGVSTFGMSGGPALQRGRVVGVILGGYSAIDLTLSVRVHLSELENVVQWDLV